MATMARVMEIIGRDLGEPSVGKEWLTWDQFGSRPHMDKVVHELKAAGIPAFFSAGERRIGIKADAIETAEAARVSLMAERTRLLARLAEIDRLLGKQ